MSNQTFPVFVTIEKANGTREQHADLFADSTLLVDILRSCGAQVFTPCARRGVCGRCVCAARGSLSERTAAELQLPSNPLYAAELEQQPAYELRLSCTTSLCGEAHLFYVEPAQSAPLTEAEIKKLVTCVHPQETPAGLAVDLGSTSVKVSVVSLAKDANGNRNPSGTVLARASSPNYQREISSDIMGRLSFAQEDPEENTRTLALLAQRSVAAASAYALHEAKLGPASISQVAVVANPAMSALFTSVDSSSLATAPFLYPEVPEQLDCTQSPWLSLVCAPHTQATMAPPLGGHVGGDAWAAAVACGFNHPADKPRLLVDMGTNTELVLVLPNGKLYCASTPAGPAFEQAALTGSELVNVLAELLSVGALDADGVLHSGIKLPAYTKTVWSTPGGATTVSAYTDQGLAWSLSQLAIRDIQLAVSAVYSGMQMLLKAAHLSAADLGKLVLCGAFGSNLEVASAVALGLIPESAQAVVTTRELAALEGAEKLLLFGSANPAHARGEQQTLELLVSPENITHVELGGNPTFTNLFMSHFSFEKRS